MQASENRTVWNQPGTLAMHFILRSHRKPLFAAFLPLLACPLLNILCAVKEISFQAFAKLSTTKNR